MPNPSPVFVDPLIQGAPPRSSLCGRTILTVLSLIFGFIFAILLSVSTNNRELLSASTLDHAGFDDTMLVVPKLSHSQGLAMSRGPSQRFAITRAPSPTLRVDSRRTKVHAANTAAPDGKFKVVYFEAYGRVETSRMMLAMAGQDFEDFRYPISFGTPGDMSTIKRAEFDADQAAGKFDYGMNMIPVIESGDFRLAQSKAIERYLAKKLGMMGSTLEEEAWVDAINEHVGDIGMAFGKKESDEQWFKNVLPTYMRKLETTLPGTQGFAVGEKLSMADVAIYRLLRDVQPPYDSKWDADVLAAYADCPKIKAIMANMEKNEALQKWMKERPKSTVE